jgi:hypothetical protein
LENAFANIAWPRTPGAPWYVDYAVLLSTAIVVASGLFYIAIAQPQIGAAAG